ADRGAGDGEPLRALRAEQVAELGERGPVALDEAAVPPARAGAAERRLDDRHPGARISLEDREGGPQARVAAADDRDVGRRIARERRRVYRAALGRECLLEPPWSRSAGRNRRLHRASLRPRQQPRAERNERERRVDGADRDEERGGERAAVVEAEERA